ncbi:hypothetical protein SAMN04487949_1475 [Halogranum gelatinilyticum]|uniref:DUF8101 domain-containing protein n=1 Tax=Halogranum gelatinilyticum TaxID=660521 RepID=A0A1G9SS59_9EURY|nr:hypothetical protein [Halogranum gelatinilyticum]SDM38299.1 hypothetical protein SAMN04487949_1475 [Halogranum gelatinilyticum]
MASLPPDVHATLTQLLSTAERNVRDGETDAVADLVATVETVTKNKVPRSSLKERLLHGCAELDGLVGDEPAVAAEYLRSMCQLVEATDRQ